MSWYQFVTARSRVFLDDNGADAAVGEIRKAVNQLPDHWEIREKSFEQGGGYVDISIKAHGESHGAPGSDIGTAMNAIGALEGRSGGAIIYESDFGVDGYELYGAAEAKVVDLSHTRGFEWCFEDTLKINVSMSAAEWRSVLGSDEGTLLEMIETAGIDLLREKVIPHFFEGIEEKSDEIEFQFFDMEPYMPDGNYADDEAVLAVYEFDGHELSGEAFELILKGFDCDAENLDRLGARVLLCFENADCEKGTWKNTVADINNMAILEFASSDNAITNIRACVIEGIGLSR